MKIKINTHGGPMPERHGEWIDLSTATPVFLKPLEYKRISFGVSMELPDGYYAEVVPRSSTCEKWGVIMGNSMDVIENDYNGDDDIWQFPALAIRETYIPEGTRICQFRLVKQQEEIELEQVNSLGNKNRGGFGSTG